VSMLADAPDGATRFRRPVGIGVSALGALVAIGVAVLFLSLLGGPRSSSGQRPQSSAHAPLTQYRSTRGATNSGWHQGRRPTNPMIPRAQSRSAQSTRPYTPAGRAPIDMGPFLFPRRELAEPMHLHRRGAVSPTAKGRVQRRCSSFDAGSCTSTPARSIRLLQADREALPDGQPDVIPVWLVFNGEELVFTTSRGAVG
jgi:hypothetical protein